MIIIYVTGKSWNLLDFMKEYIINKYQKPKCLPWNPGNPTGPGNPSWPGNPGSPLSPVK